MSNRQPPWYYPRDKIPHARTLRRWRKLATQMAKAVGAPMACGICKRPLRQWGRLTIRHPRSYGKSRNRNICTACTNLIIHMVDVLEWHGAEDHLSPESFSDAIASKAFRDDATPDLRQ